jgi:rhodanese-related sulfurtransferase
MSEIPIEIDVKTVHEMQQRGDDFLLLDCRNDEEVQFVRIEGSKHIPMPQVPERVGELAGDKTKPIVVHCHHGGRSLRVAHWLRQQGFANVRNMTGGIDRWALEIETGMARY